MAFARFLFCFSVFTISTLCFAEGFGQPSYNGNGQPYYNGNGGQRPPPNYNNSGRRPPPPQQGGAPYGNEQYGPPGQDFQGQGGQPNQGFGQAPNYNGNGGYRGAPPTNGYRGGPPTAGYRGGPPNQAGNGNNSTPTENYDPNVGSDTQQDGGELQVNYEPPSAQIIEGSRIAAAHVMRHSMEMLTTCSMIRANQFRVRDTLLDEISGKGGYINHVYKNVISGANTPSDPSSKGNNKYEDVGYPVCWWIDEMRLNAARLISGTKLSQIISRTEYPEIYNKNQKAVFEYAKRLAISSQAAIAGTYFYVETLHRTCISTSPEDTAKADLDLRPYYCPGDVNTLKFDLVALEAKAATLRNLLDNVRRFDNFKPGLPSEECIECTFRVYRYNPASTQRQNYVPYPFFPYAEVNGQQSERNPYVVYSQIPSKYMRTKNTDPKVGRMVSAPGIEPQKDDLVVARYDGVSWQQAWDTYDLRYLNPSSPNASRVGAPPVPGRTSAPPVPRQSSGVNGLPATNALAYPFSTQPSDASNPVPTTTPSGQPDTQPPAQNPQLDAEPVPYGDLDPTQPRQQQ